MLYEKDGRLSQFYHCRLSNGVTMTIGNVIRKYRKELGLTQEEMANRLGVTAPAVNKWEMGHTQPDIGLLAPTARLLGITTDTLLSFREDLTDEEISLFVKDTGRQLEILPYAEAFSLAKEKIGEYPNCLKLILNIALLLEHQRLNQEIPDKVGYDEQICEWYLRVLEAEDESLKKAAAQSLYWFYSRKSRFADAEKYLEYFPKDDPDRSRCQALIYSQAGRFEEAYKTLESLLLSEFNRLRMILNDLRILYMKNDDHVMAHKIADMESSLAGLFEMGRYQEASAGLELATWEKDVEETERIMRILLKSLDTLTDFMHSPLYRHIPSKAMDSSFFHQLKDNLIKGFLAEEAYGYMRGNPYWEELKASNT